MFITFDLCDFFFVVLSVIRKQFLKKTELLQVDQSVLVDQILNKQCHQHRILGVESQMSLLQNINSCKEQRETRARGCIRILQHSFQNTLKCFFFPGPKI